MACATDNSKLVTVGGDKQVTGAAGLCVLACCRSGGSETRCVPSCHQVFYYDVATGSTIRKFKGHDRCVHGTHGCLTPVRLCV